MPPKDQWGPVGNVGTDDQACARILPEEVVASMTGWLGLTPMRPSSRMGIVKKMMGLASLQKNGECEKILRISVKWVLDL